MLRPQIMGPPVAWLLSEHADGFSGRRITAARWDTTLAPAVADALIERFPVEWVRVRVRKPEVRPIGLEVEYSGVTVERRRS